MGTHPTDPLIGKEEARVEMQRLIDACAIFVPRSARKKIAKYFRQISRETA